MPALQLLVFAGALMLASIPLARADEVPVLNTAPGCRAATSAAVSNSRDENACKADEQAAHDKLKEEWGQFNASQKQQCIRLTTLGGPPSYVELLTCLEMAKGAADLPDELGKMDKIDR